MTVKEIREALAVFRVRDARIAQDIVEAAARAFADLLELPPEAVEAAAYQIHRDVEGPSDLFLGDTCPCVDVAETALRAALAAGGGSSVRIRGDAIGMLGKIARGEFTVDE